MTGLAAATLIAGLAATAVAIEGVADPGVQFDSSGSKVEAVSPTGYAWPRGIRSGQTVQVAGETLDGHWLLETVDPLGKHVVDGTAADRQLAESLPAGVAALLLAVLAVLFLRTHRRWVAPVAAVALLAAAEPLERHGVALPSTLVLAAAAAVPLASFGALFHGRARRALFVAILTAVGIWALLRLAGAPLYDVGEDLREGIAFWAVVALILQRGWSSAMTGQAIGVVRPRMLDVAAITAIVIVAATAKVMLNLPFEVIGILVILVLAVIPATRQRLGHPIEDALFSDVREQAAVEATERERARLAREIHDVPLQELVAVIRRLEIQPGAEAETEDLRALAGHLRNVATELRPPVLDDLGLPAALDYLAEQSSTPSVPVTATVDDQTGFGEERRPPTDVELAMYRIASEAVGNAIRHAGGSVVRIDATVAPDRVTLDVTDDGAGLAPEKARDATRRKRLGLTSMRRRAEAIDAELSIDGSGGGTRVRVVWQA